MPKRNLKFTDRWMFNRVLCEKEVCRKVLRAALGIEVGEIAYLNAEQAKEPAAASRGVRMDVFAREGNRVFDIEMQVSPEDRIGRRMRYYQAAIDATELGPGEDYELIPESFVVFFCTADPFRAGSAVYSIALRCRLVNSCSSGATFATLPFPPYSSARLIPIERRKRDGKQARGEHASQHGPALVFQAGRPDCGRGGADGRHAGRLRAAEPDQDGPDGN